MIVSTFSFAVHVLVSSFRVLKPVAEVLEFVLPYRNFYTRAIMGKNINFNTKHLGKGDPLPPYNGKLRLYNMRYCPYAQRTVLALLAKGLDFEVINVHLFNKPDWLFVKSPLGKVPSLEIEENITISESLITVEYIDEAFTQRPLLPKDPVKKAIDKMLAEITSSVLSSTFMKALRYPDTITEETVSGYHKALGHLQDELNKRGSKFLFGGEPGYVDYMIWPWIERAELMTDSDGRLAIGAPKFKRLLEYIEDMHKDPAIAAYMVPKEALAEVLLGYRGDNPNPNYDYLLTKK